MAIKKIHFNIHVKLKHIVNFVKHAEYNHKPNEKQGLQRGKMLGDGRQVTF